MGRWTVAHRTVAVRFNYEAKFVIRTQRGLGPQFGVPRQGVIPSRNRILLWTHKFEDTDSARNSPHSASKTVCTEIIAEQENYCVVHVAQL
jgi:hypothetical protein